MRKLYPRILLVLLMALLGSNAFAQQVLTDAIKAQDLQTLSSTLDAKYNTSRQKAYNLAKQKGWITHGVKPDGTTVTLQGVDDTGRPFYLITHNNTIAAATTRTNTVQPGGALGLNLNGSSTSVANKLAIWDAGLVYLAHQEYAGKTIVNRDGASQISDHSNHVAGTMIAKGVYAPAKGMAFGATSLISFDFNNDATEMAANAASLLLSNHSYGYLAGWFQNSDQGNRWEWYGLPGDSEDYTFGFYSTNTRAYDQIAYSAPKYLIVAAAGNNRGETGPIVGGTYYGYNTRTDFTIVNKGPRPANISSNNGFDVIVETANAKNILTVGAVYPLTNGPSTSSDIVIAPFSSLGPTDDGRVKPDICGDGVNVTSTGVGTPTSYLTLSGTSMATPNVTGSLYLLQEYYAQKNSGNFMLSSTLKGLACHTAFDAGNPGPDYTYGWGLLDMSAAAQAMIDNGTKSIVSEKTLAQGQTQTVTVTASGNGPLKATIVWTDPAGTATTTGTINSRTPKLVNDLDIRVSDGTTTFTPWKLDPNNPSANATTGDNIVDNVEQVYIANAVPGVNYTIIVTHKGTLSGSQAYSLIVTGIGGATYCTSAPLSSADSRINNVTLSTINNTPGAGCTTYSNYTNLTATLEQGKTYPLSLTLGTCGANFNKIAKVYIDWNGNGTFTDAGELVATSGVINATGTYTTNITVPTSVVPGNISLMRVVLTETTDPTSINPCGTYAKGETQDYKVSFVKPAIDAGVTAINTPAASGTCPSNTSTVSVHLKNFGTSTLTSIPVTVTITNSLGVVSTLTDTYTGSLAPLGEDDFTLSGTFTAASGATYTVVATTTLAADPITINNQTTGTAVINLSSSITAASAIYCTDAKAYNLNATGSGQIFWYKNIGDALPFTYGASVTTTQTPVNNTFYAGLNDFSGNVGPATKNVFGGGAYNQFTPAVYVTTKVPVLIQSARLYVGYPGKITFNVSTSGGAIVSSTTINAAATRSAPATGQTADDPTDVGKVYNLNLSIPAAGTYTISAIYADNATLYRNSANVTGYPFNLANLFSISGNDVNAGIDTTSYKTYYYYFYDMHVVSLGCAAPARLAAQLVKPVITQTGVNLSSNFGSNNQWYLNGVAIAGAIAQTYTPKTSGVYRVDVTSASGCVSKSDDFSFVLPAKDNSDGAEISLAMFPVPTSGKLNLAFNAIKTEQLIITIANTVGQYIYKDSRTLPAGPYNSIIDLTSVPAGTYFVRLVIGDKTYQRNISVVK